MVHVDQRQTRNAAARQSLRRPRTDAPDAHDHDMGLPYAFSTLYAIQTLQATKSPCMEIAGVFGNRGHEWQHRYSGLAYLPMQGSRSARTDAQHSQQTAQIQG